MHAVFIRAPWVEEAGEGVEVLGRVVGGPADGRIVAVRQGNLVATSFHPELTGDRRVHALFVDIVRRHLAEQAGARRREREGYAMSGHSKWATTKHKKAGIDAKRGKLFAKLIKNIEVAARTGGGDLSGNPTLFDAVQKAKKSSVPNDNIDRAVKRGSGAEAGGVDYQGITYEGYARRRRRRPHRVPHRQQEPLGHGGPHRHDPQRRVDGRPRARSPTCSPARASSWCRRPTASTRTPCSWPCSTPAPRRCATSATPSRWSASRPTWSPCAPRCRTPASTTTPPRPGSCPASPSSSTRTNAGKVFRLIDALEDCDDVQNVYANYDVSDEVLEKVG